MPALQDYVTRRLKPTNIAEAYLTDRTKEKQRVSAARKDWDYCCVVTRKSNPYVEIAHSLEERAKHWSIVFVGAKAWNNLELEFHTLAKQWKEETGELSSLSKVCSNWNYLRIIALGEGAVPLILRELQREPAPWFVALEAISGEHNIGRQFAGNFRKMAAEWLEWGAARGLI